jgi:CO/xanthine dehydrogenase FAD-binding subunit
LKPPPFAYHRPESLDAALRLLADDPDAKPLAGGQSLIPLLNFRLARPSALVDLGGVAELAGIRVEDGALVVGTMTRQWDLEHAEQAHPLLREALRFVGHTATRCRGTLGGSLVHADPTAELPVCALALGAELVAAGPRGRRTIPAEQFFVSVFTTALQPGELLVEIRFPPRPARTGYAWEEYARRHGDFALAGVAAVISLASDGVCTSARLVYTGVGPVPFDAHQAAELLVGQRPSSEAFRLAAERAAADCEPDSDVHASADYRRHLVRGLTRRALERAASRVTDGSGA